MTIVQVNSTCGSGSTGDIALDIHRAARDAGHKSYIFWATRCPEQYRRDSNIIRIGSTLDHKLHAILRRLNHSQGFNSRLATKALCRKLAAIKPDIVHLHNLHANYMHLPTMLRFLAKHRIATAITLHDCWLFTGYCMHFTAFRCFQWQQGNCSNCVAVKAAVRQRVADYFKQKKALFAAIPTLGVIGVSDWITECGKRSLCGTATLFQRIYNWIDASVFFPRDNSAAVREKYGIAPGKKMILGVSAAWTPEKGIAEFKYLAESLKEDAVVVLVGKPSGNISTGSLKFIGPLVDAHALAALYSAADVFANPSGMETFGKVTAEAMFCGTPVVAYNNTGTAELVNEQVGMLVADGDKEAFLQAIRAVLMAPKKRYSEACRHFARKNFNKEQLLRQHLEFYRELLQAARGTVINEH